MSTHNTTELLQIDTFGEVAVECFDHGLEQVIINRPTAASVAGMNLPCHLPQIFNSDDPLVVHVEQTENILQVRHFGTATAAGAADHISLLGQYVQNQLDIDLVGGVAAVVVFVVIVVSGRPLPRQ